MNEVKARERLLAESTFRSGIVFEEGDLFLAMPRELSVIIERVLRRERKASAVFKWLPPIAQGRTLCLGVGIWRGRGVMRTS